MLADSAKILERKNPPIYHNEILRITDQFNQWLKNALSPAVRSLGTGNRIPSRRMKRYLSLLLFLIVRVFAYSYTDEFSKAVSRPYEHNWEGHILNAEEEKRLDDALSQSYHYMNAGTQCAAFISKDGKYILKFFKKKRFLPPAASDGFSIPFFTNWRMERKRNKCQIKRDRIFSAYTISCDRLSQQTGVFFVHFNSTGRLKRSIQLSDASGKTLDVALDDWDFVLERRAEPLRDYLERLLGTGDVAAAGVAVHRLLELQRIFFHKGMRNRDIEFVNNYGFIDGTPVLFDVGRLLPAIDLLGREKYQKKLKSFLPAFREWIVYFYPLLIPYCDTAIARLQSTLYDDPDEFSMTCFHPYELKWEGHALDGDENRVLKRALSQPYRYLSQGGQSCAFVSEDDRYVIKFFKQKMFSLPEQQDRFVFASRFFKARKHNQRAGKRDRIYSGYKIACDMLPQETGILYVHFNTTSHLRETLSLTLPSGQSLSVDLDDCDFIVARRAVTLPKHLNALLAEGKVKEAGESLRRMLELYCVFFQKNVRDRDVAIANNYGFVDGAPVLFDAGRLLPCSGQEAKKKYRKKMQTLLPSFRNWIKAQYPMLIPYCDAAIGKILETVYLEEK